MLSVGATDNTESHESTSSLVKINCSWHCATENGLNNALIVQEDAGDMEDPTSFMSVETCIFLTREGREISKSDCDNKTCSITLQISKNYVISNLSILSEARLIEIHGQCEEYLKTVRAEFLLEVDDTTVYCADIKLDTPSNNIMLKLNRLSRENDLWVYGLLVRWKAGSSEAQTSLSHSIENSPFPFEAVDRRLNDLGQDLSLNAQQYKKILELCCLKSGNSRGDVQDRPSISTLVASMFQGNHVKDCASDQTSQLENLLDEKFKQFEHHILTGVDKRIKEMERRQQTLITDGFDRLMRQLELNFDLGKEESSS